MKPRNDQSAHAHDRDAGQNADIEFNVFLGWLAAISITIASAALSIVT